MMVVGTGFWIVFTCIVAVVISVVVSIFTLHSCVLDLDEPLTRSNSGAHPPIHPTPLITYTIQSSVYEVPSGKTHSGVGLGLEWHIWEFDVVMDAV